MDIFNAAPAAIILVIITNTVRDWGENMRNDASNLSG